MQHSLLGLFKTRRFAPFFIVQSLGAFNDNVFKNAVAFMVTYQAARYGLDKGLSDIFANLLLLAIILPFFLFSAIAGQIADKYEKSALIRKIKFIEIVLMALATYGFARGQINWLVFVALLMGTQSAFFGPIKYGILPQHLRENELVAGNAAVETGTFIAILLGVIVGNKLMSIEHYGLLGVTLAVMGIAVAGYLASRHVPQAAAADPALRMNWNIFSATWQTLQYSRASASVFTAILGISWFWFFGATVLTQIPNYSQYYLLGDEHVNILLLALFSIGIGLGAVLCDKLSGEALELRLVPLGAVLLSLFALLLWWCSPDRLSSQPALEQLHDVAGFLQRPGAWGVVTAVLGLGAAGGLFTVPLYALVQQRSTPRYRSRIIAGLNILNSLFMVISALAAMLWLSAGMTISSLFAALAVLNVLVALSLFIYMPAFVRGHLGHAD